MSCSRIALSVIGAVAIAAEVFAAPGASAQAVTADPAALVRALHAGPAGGTGLTTIYEMGTRRLRRMLMGRSLCTVPVSKRAIVCTDSIGVLGAATAVVNDAVDGAKPGTKIVTVMRVAQVPREVRFIFSRSAAGWQIDEIAAPGVSDWPLAPLTGEPTATPTKDPGPAQIETPAPVASATMRRADRQRRLTRQN